ncbi:protein-disulfide reductase DsbD N-terminal domain-containing protein [Streptomyces bambusae]|uniref:protein-disulfide reductase DsbD domain-containing protein n=1 Tax=Streptomyces bambusae TaxID=1550616 RepID=UPI001CFCEFE8|nr:protein-disulfide reductase DsbD domain-containing protein [Streptomyces bambusae]MCB5165858.1 protein-disulfide reductase DsbD N-terminal domain-containing protein [Streptomyces bambusae]
MRRHAPEAQPHASRAVRGTRRRTGGPGPVRVAVAAAVLLAATAVTGCGQDEAAAKPPAAVTEFNENGVTVRLSVADWDASAGTVEATFTPDEPGFHLYSTSLPAEGVEGVGRPTEVRASGGVAAAGKLTVDAPVKTIRVPGVEAAVPVYPDGPVTARLPIRATASGEARLLIGYASCSSTEGCTIPVADRAVTVHTTADHLSFTAG